MPYGKDKGDVMRKKVGRKSKKKKMGYKEGSYAEPTYQERMGNKMGKKGYKRTWEGNSGVDDGSHVHSGH